MKDIQSDEEFNELVTNNKVVVIFSASWCGPCHKMKDELDAAGTEKELETEKGIKFCVVDVDRSDELSEKYGIEAMPTTLFFNKSTTPHPNEKIVGAKPAGPFKNVALRALDGE